MDVTTITTLTASLLTASAVAVAVDAALSSERRQRKSAARVPPTIERRLDDLSTSMRQSARLVEEVSAELELRAAAARQLEEDAKAAEALAALHKDQADAIRRMMDAELETVGRRIRRDSIVIGVASFVAGVGATVLVTLLLH